jgi:hypothetical protein
MSFRFVLRCARCGLCQAVEGTHQPAFAFEVAYAANDIGWKGILDILHNRSVVFCSQECFDASLNKDGKSLPARIRKGPRPASSPTPQPEEVVEDAEEEGKQEG